MDENEKARIRAIVPLATTILTELRVNSALQQITLARLGVPQEQISALHARATSDSRSYTCTVTNAYGSAAHTFSLTVNAAGNAPVITCTSGGGGGPAGSSTTLSISYTGTVTTFAWYHDGSRLLDYSGSTLTVTRGASTSYSVTISNSYGSDSASWSIWST